MSLPEPPAYDDRPERWELLVPFVATVSHGGAYEDVAFVAGVQVGKVLGELTPRDIAATTSMVYVALVEQMDLVAMRCGYSSEVLWQDDDWAHVGFTRVDR